MFRPSQIALSITGLAVPILAVSTLVHAQTTTCTPDDTNRPVCPSTATMTKASFIDPTATLSHHNHVRLGEQVYIGPFSELKDHEHGHEAHITIGNKSNLQDHIKIHAHWHHNRTETDKQKVDSLQLPDGVHIGERVIFAHGTIIVKGSAEIGVRGENNVTIGTNTNNPPSTASFTNDPPETFISFGAEIDGARVDKNTVVSALARVGPGVHLRSGYVVLPGKNLIDPNDETRTTTVNGVAPKVRHITQADLEFANLVIEANEKLAEGYSRLVKDPGGSINKVQGISVDPGTLSTGEQTPHFGSTMSVDSEGYGSCSGGSGHTDHNFRNRIIGQVFFKQAASALTNDVMKHGISIRGDEGKDICIGTIAHMSDNVVIHALEKALEPSLALKDKLFIGDNVSYGNRAIVHGGLAQDATRVDTVVEELPPTKIGNNVTLGDDTVVFRSTIEDGFTIGAKSLILNADVTSALPGITNKTIPPKSFVTTNCQVTNGTTNCQTGLALNAIEW
ncbi:LbetaH domain-containing protein [Mastigocladopsis repens]|uniref:hypothetical protein n=1 Tax=Mastigocladopsis repens TaxID=221287 RepID=UPI0002FF8B32|nr:hypothetical protein [Mastigocladopsis repens]